MSTLVKSAISISIFKGPPGPTGEPGKAEIQNNENVCHCDVIVLFSHNEELK